MPQGKPSQAGEQVAEQSGEAQSAQKLYEMPDCLQNSDVLFSRTIHTQLARYRSLLGWLGQSAGASADSTLQASLGLPLAMSRRSASAPASTEGGPLPKPQRCTTSPVHASCFT